MAGDVRWIQRLQNYQKALGWLEASLAIPTPDVIQRAGMVQFFEMTFELGWKLAKDFLEEQGFTDVSTPRAVLKKAFEVGLIEDGRGWLEGLDDRNLTSHTYDEAVASKVENLIRDHYLVLFKQLSGSMESRR